MYHLINFYKQIQGENLLINELIQLTTDEIKFTTEEILRDTFEKPTSTTCIYAILFEDCFKNSSLRQKIIDQLLTIWNSWEQSGFLANQIMVWKNISNDQRQIIYRIWNYISEIAGKQYQIDKLIAKQELEMDEKIQIKEKITKCLDIYCQNACDKDLYLQLLLEIDKQLKSGIVRSITIPEEIQILLPLANELNPLEKLRSWKTYLIENRKCKENFEFKFIQRLFFFSLNFYR